MPNFRYRAKEGPKNIQGILAAQTKAEAIEKLHQMGYVPVQVELESPTTRLERKTAPSSPSSTAPAAPRLSRGGIKSKDLTVFSWQLAGLIKSGVPILRSLQIIVQQSENHSFRKIVEDVQNNIKDGQALSAALAGYPKVFPSLYVAMIRSGESSGTLQEVLSKIAEYRQKQEEIVARVRMALAYPVFMIMVGAGTIFFMFTFVMPRLTQIFSSIGQELPLPTRILLAISASLRKGWPLILVGLAALVMIFRRAAEQPAQKMAMSRLKLRMPFLGDLIQKSELARFCGTLEMLLKSGIPILKALEVATPVVGNGVIQEELRKSYDALKEGGSFGKSLEHSKLFPPFMTNLIVIGEESGRLTEGLAEIAISYTRATEDSIKVMTTLLEPVIILVMGLIVGFIVIAMLLPIFQIDVVAK